MEPLNIEATEDSPQVILDDEKQIFLFEGESRPHHAYNFYQPVIQWLEGYGKILFWQKQHFGKNRRMTVQVKLSYFNSTSAKFIGDILLLLDSLCKDGYEIRVKWFYQKEDVDMKESAEEYMKMVKQLPIILVLNDGSDPQN